MRNLTYVFYCMLYQHTVSGLYLLNIPPLTCLFTPPKPSEESMTNWSVKVKPVLAPHLLYKPMLKVGRKSWVPFRIYQLTKAKLF